MSERACREMTLEEVLKSERMALHDDHLALRQYRALVAAGAKPDRAARIRALAEDLVRASTSDLLYEPQPTQADLASQRWHLAMLITDLFDQLEAEERAREADRE